MAGAARLREMCLPLLLGAGGMAAAQVPDLPTAENCIACHSGLADDTGRDVSIGHDWRATMMAHAARDPYWQASVRRETIDHPTHGAEIEDTCATCHMPAARVAAQAAGEPGRVFDNLVPDAPGTRAALDGVTCTVCHGIAHDGLGDPASFDGGFRIDPGGDDGARPAFGPFEVDAGLQRVMHSASGVVPTEGGHIQSSELCATCHTLFTRPLGEHATGDPFPEQVPYLEWQQSNYNPERSCQSCHMPTAGPAPITSVLGEPREGLSRHQFRGGNAFMLRLLDTYRGELGVTAPSEDLQRAADATEHHLRTETATLGIARLDRDGDHLVLEVRVDNLAGHKLPTAYPSRRAWLHLVVRSADGITIFESGALQPDGSIAGNDNDREGDRFEPHYAEITAPDQVQIYEPIVVDARDRVTTGLLHAVRYTKDNRLLPAGFDKHAASPETAVLGRAAADKDFDGGGDTVRYRIPIGAEIGSAAVSVKLMFQTIGYRWAENLASYDSRETARFTRYYRASADRSAIALAKVEARWHPP